MGDDTSNVIQDGMFGAVVQARDIGSVVVQVPAAPPPALHGLPAGDPAFTGRDTDLEAISARLADPDTGSIVLICGMGGVGKTELAVQAGHRALKSGRFPGGVLFMDLFGYDDDRRLTAAQALDGCLRALGVAAEHIPPDEQGRARLHASVLAANARKGRRMLVVVDNAADTEQVRPLLPADPETAVIVTSRHTLGLLGAGQIELAALSVHDSVRLLDRALRTAYADDDRVAEHPEAARHIALQCAGLPLALQIIAALLAENRRRPIAEVASVLADAETRLAELAHPAAAVQAAFDLSYRDLDPEQARLFRLLPANPGPDFSTDAVAAMVELPANTVRRLLEGLARAHLIERGSVYGRWRMHDLIRIYAALCDEVEAGERTQAAIYLFAYYHANALAAASHISPVIAPPADSAFGDRDTALTWLDSEYSNVIAAALLIASADAGTELRPLEIVVGLVLDLWRYFELRRRFDDWIVLTTIALRGAQELGRRDHEAAALSNLGGALRQARRFDEAIEYCRRAIGISQELENVRTEGTARNNLSAALTEAGRYEEARENCHETIRLFRAAGDRHREGIAVHHLGQALKRLGRPEEAAAAFRGAIALFRESGDSNGEAVAVASLAGALTESGQADQALELLRDSSRSMGASNVDRHKAASVHHNLGSALLAADRFLEAAAEYENACTAFRETRDAEHAALSLRHRGLALFRAGNLEEAEADLRRSAADARRLGATETAARALLDLGHLLRDTARHEEAVATFQDAAESFRGIGDAHGKAEALGGLATVLGLSRADEVLAVAEEGLEASRAVGDREMEVLFRNMLGTFKLNANLFRRHAKLLQAGRFEELIAEYDGVPEVLRQFGDRRGAAQVLKTVGIALLESGRTADAITALTDAASSYGELGDASAEGESLNRLGVALQEAGRLAEAVTAHTRAAELLRTAGDQGQEGVARTNLGIALQELNRPEEAVQALEHAIELLHAAEDPIGESIARHTLASLTVR